MVRTFDRWKKAEEWGLILILSSLVTVHAKSIIPSTTILSSTILSSRYQSSSSIFYSSDEVGRSQELLEGVKLPSTCNSGSITLPTSFDINNCRDKDDIEDDYPDISQDAAFQDRSDPLVPIATNTAIATTSLPLDNAVAVGTPGASAILMHRPSQRMMSNSNTTTANEIFMYSLAMISGFGEICSLKSYGCFINMVTGSSVRILMGLVEGQFDTIYTPVCVIIGYISGIILARIIIYHYDSVEPPIQHKDVPSQQKQRAFSKTPNSRFDLRKSLLASRERNLSSELLWSVTPLILVLFSLTESMNAVSKMIFRSNTVQIPLLFNVFIQAIGYGLIAQVLSDVQTIPTNVYVLTGHYVTLTKSFIDQHLEGRQTVENDMAPSTTIRSKIQRLLGFVPTVQQRQSTQILLFFAIGTVLASLMYKHFSFLLPIQHTLTGLMYILSFLWYSLRLSSSATS